MRERIIAGNWKMNTTLQEGVELARNVAQAVKGIDNVAVVICPPATHLSAVGEAIKGSSVGLGAQNVHWEEKGAFTGEISPLMLEEFGCRWVIIGHSERRYWFGETDKIVNHRLHRALKTGIRPIVCIGETLEEMESGRAYTVIEAQLKGSLDEVQLTGRGGVVIAYEPVWAIGTGRNATPGEAQEAHSFIRKMLTMMYDKETSENTVIQYGGSMNEKNAVELMACEDVDGGLIGGASLSVDKFSAIVRAASSTS